MVGVTPILGPDGRPLNRADVLSSTALPALNRNWWNNVPTTGVFYWPDSVGIDIYERMVRTDETVYSGIKFTVLAVLSRLGEFTHPKRKIQQAFREMVNNMRTPLSFAVAQILTALWAGFSVSEILWAADSGRWDIDAIFAVHPRTLTFILETRDDMPRKNELVSIVQWYRATYEVDLPLAKVIRYSHDEQFGNPYGNSRLRSVFKNWLVKDRILIAWAMTLERYGTPLAIGTLPNGSQPVSVPGGGTMSATEHLLMLLDQLQGKSSLVVTGDTKIQIEQTKRALGGDFEGAVEVLNIAIHKGLLTPSLIAGHGGGHGSYKLGDKHFDTFEIGVNELSQDVILILLNQLAKPWITVNFGKQKEYGSFELHPLGEEDRKMLSETLGNLITHGIAFPERADDLNAMRKRFDLEEIPADATGAPDIGGTEAGDDSPRNEGGEPPSKPDAPPVTKGGATSLAKEKKSRQKINDMRSALLADVNL